MPCRPCATIHAPDRTRDADLPASRSPHVRQEASDCFTVRREKLKKQGEYTNVACSGHDMGPTCERQAHASGQSSKPQAYHWLRLGFSVTESGGGAYADEYDPLGFPWNRR